MNVKMEKIEQNIVKLEVTVEVEKFNEALKKSYAKNSKKFNLPGFRKGKAPINMIKRYYGEGVFFEDAINFCCDDTYPEAIKENNLRPVDYPKIDIVQIGENQQFIYTAEVTLYPEVELGEYKGVEVKKVEYNVSDEEVEAQLKSLQEKNARVESKTEGTVEKGNIAVIDFKGFVDGIAFEGGEGKDYSLEIGSGTFIDTFEDQLVGMQIGENKNVNVNFPEQYGREELNGKPAVFEVTVKEIKVKELPAIDDEFAQEVSEFDTLEELKADTRKKMQEANDTRAKREYEEAVIDAVCENAKAEIPEVMVNKEIDNMVKDLEMRLKYQGLDLQTYYEYTNSSEEKVREFMKESAEKRVKTELVLDKISKLENVEATEEELKEKALELAKQYGEKEIEKTAELLLQVQKDYIKLDIVNEKVIKLLVDSSKATA
ncbi:trigger factor [Clostridium sp. YIM B02515]|uniref:Trigger factor n=1 Tax=Clostridium rhizosphaerae TaxID=2803861 RepID=A0ABS1T8Z9_9CLOT|nr:trigger factor [Clostridium rhizosphaerae]MBL4935741.1 trigger factor [Clostridium rhizosphaerae]